MEVFKQYVNNIHGASDTAVQRLSSSERQALSGHRREADKKLAAYNQESKKPPGRNAARAKMNADEHRQGVLRGMARFVNDHSEKLNEIFHRAGLTPVNMNAWII